MLDLRYFSILKVAIPLMVSSLIQSIVMITDSAFLSRYDTISFDAAGNAGMIVFTLYVLLMGMSDGSQILMARRIGENRTRVLPHVFGSVFLLNFIIATFLFLIAQFLLPGLVDRIVQDPRIAVQEQTFVKIRSIGLFFSVISLAIIAYFTAIGKTRLVLFSALIIAGSNILLDYAMIFGNLGFPRLGLEGAAWASTAADGLGMLFLTSVFVSNKHQQQHKIILHLRAKKDTIRRLISIGSPVMFQMLVALTTWTTFFIWIEQMGTFELTVSQTIRSLYFLAFVPIWGFSGTTKTYISQYMGNGAFHQIPVIQKKIKILTIASLLVTTHGLILYPEALVSMINPNELYVEKSAAILRLIYGSILVYGFAAVYFHTIGGTGNTRFSFYIEFISVLIYIFCSYLFIKVYKWDIYWVWVVEYIYFVTLGSLSWLYLRLFNWKSKEI